MRKRNAFAPLFVLVLWALSGSVLAGPPLTNLEGVGGIAFNPLAYPADSTGKNTHAVSGKTEVIGAPRIGAWYVDLSDPSIDWTSLGIAETFFKRIEVSYGYEAVAVAGTADFHKSNLGAKVLLVPEGALASPGIPAISVGVIRKSVFTVIGGKKFEIEDLFGSKVKGADADFYLVATKLIKSSVPVLLSGGVLSTTGRTTGVLGFDEDRKTSGFGNIDVILPIHTAVGFEYQKGAEFEDFKNLPNAHGSIGKIIKISLPNIIVLDEREKTEKVVLIDDKTKIRMAREDAKAGDLRLEDKIIVIGTPNEQGQIEAKLIRLIVAPLEDPFIQD